jgi:hypothetical protein
MKGLLYSRTREEFLYNLIVFLLWVALMTLFMRFLWNSVLVKHITILRPVDSLTHTFLLALGISLFHL